VSGASAPGAGVVRRSVPRARLTDLAALRAFVAAACAEVGAPPAVGEALVLAADEVCSNIVLHGYGPGMPGPITIEVERAADGARMTIADEGRAFDPADAPAPDLDAPWEQREAGGLGWYIVRRMVDELRYERRSGVNLVTLVKRAP
jgi:serine/threonine-protein kinase RsbW